MEEQNNKPVKKPIFLCKYCRGQIKEGASKCEHCGEFQTHCRIILGLIVFFFIPIIAFGITIYNVCSTTRDRVDAKTALRTAEKVKEEVTRQKVLVELWVETVLAVNARKAFRASSFLDKILELEPDNKLSLELQMESLIIAASNMDPNDPNKVDILQKARKTIEKLQTIDNIGYAYEMACVHALSGDEEDCRAWLLLAQTKGTLPPKDSIPIPILRKYFGEFATRKWFQELKWPKEEN